MADVAIADQTDGTRLQADDLLPVSRGGAGRKAKAIESGTFTPTILFGGSATGNTYGAQVGRYQRIGNRVFIQLFVSLTAKTATGGNIMTIGGLPVTSEATANNNCTLAVRMNNLNTTTTSPNHLATVLVPSATAVNLQYMNTTTGASTNLVDDSATATTNCMISGSYEV